MDLKDTSPSLTRFCNDVDFFKDEKTIAAPIQDVDKGPDLRNIAHCKVATSTAKQGVETDLQSEKRYGPISKKKLNEFQCLVKSVPLGTTFKKAWREFLPLRECFSKSYETELEIEGYFDQARESLPKLKTLHTIEDQGFFSVPFSINGCYIEDSLCDSGAASNFITEKTVNRLELKKMMHPATMNVGLVDGTIVSPVGELKNVPLLFGSCQVPTDFLVIMEHPYVEPIILGRSFLATTGVVMDWPNKRVSLTNIDKEIFYPLAPLGIRARPIHYVPGEKGLLSKRSCGYSSEEDDGYVLKRATTRARRDPNSPNSSHS